MSDPNRDPKRDPIIATYDVRVTIRGVVDAAFVRPTNSEVEEGTVNGIVDRIATSGATLPDGLLVTARAERTDQ